MIRGVFYGLLLFLLVAHLLAPEWAGYADRQSYNAIMIGWNK
jgi:hypothetical protein